VQTNDEIVTAALVAGYCGYHGIGSCAMDPASKTWPTANFASVESLLGIRLPHK
jgi:hypothetical protein